MKIQDLKNKKVLILGLGREGFDTYIYLRKLFPEKRLAIADTRGVLQFDDFVQKSLLVDRNLDLCLGSNYLSCLNDYEVIIKSPGIRLADFKNDLSDGIIITSQTNIFFDNCPAMIIGITGTKGKSTTSTLLYDLFKNNGDDVYLLGNIEKPALSFLDVVNKDSIIVYELSCHQLQLLEKSPKIAIFLNFFPEHLDYYGNMDEYFKAKANIFLHQKEDDYLIYNSDIEEIEKMKELIVAKKIIIDPNECNVICDSDNDLKNITNEVNIAAVIEVARIFGISNDAILRTLRGYKRLPHRLEYLGNYNGIDFYDDSIATIPEAVIYALSVLGEKVETIILGGLNRGIEFDKLADELINSKVRNLILFPESGKVIKDCIVRKASNSCFNFFEVETMKDAVVFAFENTEKGNICLLSPASPSFNLFKDYKERGEAFKNSIKQYASKEKT